MLWYVEPIEDNVVREGGWLVCVFRPGQVLLSYLRVGGVASCDSSLHLFLVLWNLERGDGLGQGSLGLKCWRDVIDDDGRNKVSVSFGVVLGVQKA